MASRVIDMKTGQFFYNDGSYIRYFDGEGIGHIDTGQFPFFAKSGTIGSCAPGATSLTYTAGQAMGSAPAQGDTLTLDVGSLRETVTINGAVTGTGPYTCPVPAIAFTHAATTLATTIQVTLAYFENQPKAQWIATLDGDGVTPPTNFFLWPRNRPRAGSSANTSANRPYYGLDISRIPVSGTLYLPSSIPGYATVGITTNWGWPAVPDVVKDITCKMAARAWRAKASGWAVEIGSPEIGVVNMGKFWDPLDQVILNRSDLVHFYL